MPSPTFRTFDDLVDDALSDPAAEAEIERRYRQHAAIVVVDFTHMVQRSDADGIVYALALARRAEHVMRPAVERNGGEIVKRVADTWFGVFAEPGPALTAVLEGMDALTGFNARRTGRIGDGSRNEPILACAGLGWGSALVVPGDDVYGEEVNRAFVLGEDTAGGGEILCTDAFLSGLGVPPPGVGAHRAPADRSADVGFSFHVLRDHRE